MKKYAIATVVLSTNLTACADPLVGDWLGVKATSNENSSDSVTLPYESCTEDYTYVDEYGNETVYEGSCSTLSFLVFGLSNLIVSITNVLTVLLSIFIYFSFTSNIICKSLNVFCLG